MSCEGNSHAYASRAYVTTDTQTIGSGVCCVCVETRKDDDRKDRPMPERPEDDGKGADADIRVSAFSPARARAFSMHHSRARRPSQRKNGPLNNPRASSNWRTPQGPQAG